ncbi:Predicted ATPase [Enhydrobacter aerosaccus]|uniref:Predicted ATPase n=1 Tax=Enhydrobacter aerosaccus TaxID=225324 RepID=A0A1T4QIW9_9HYPH|nr:AAA family ATPase [Enhydrobacter aerosaccus]SKA03441.1 Predicted ATPase [Enhydrobacter aerosaccus]
MAVGHNFIVREIHAANYRSLRSIRFPVGALTVFVGANGVGKTNLYRGLQLLQAAAAGTLALELAREGGMNSALWAGRRRADVPVRIALSAGFGGPASGSDTVYSYRIETGLPAPSGPGAFALEPQIKEETLLFHHGGRATKLLQRRGPALVARDCEEGRVEIARDLLASETALASLDEPQRFPEVHAIRHAMLDWRFYHSLRTDSDSALRRPCLAVTTPTLAADGSNLAAVLATLVHIRKDSAALDRAVADAFPGAVLDIPYPESHASFGMIFPDHPRRVFQAAELSDGTLRYLALMGALMALRLPAFIALNEPESSLHPDLLEPLARLIAQAAERTQIWLVTHSERLALALAKHGGVQPRTVLKKEGETWIEGLTQIGRFEGED